MKDSSRNNNAEIFSNLSENFSSHFIELCSSSDGDTVNPYDYFSQLIEWENSNADQIRNDQETLSRVLIEILNYFEIASVATRIGDAYLFYKYFTQMLFKAISVHAYLKKNQFWINPPNYLKNFDSEIEEKFLCSLFPEIYQEVGNINKSHFIDWFQELLDKLADSGFIPLEPFTYENMIAFVRFVYRRDYLVNFRRVEHLQNVYRSPNPAKFLDELDLLEKFFIENNITQIIDLRGEKEASESAYIHALLKKHSMKFLLVGFNEPKSSEISGSSYKKKLYYLKDVVKTVFQAILEHSGATLFHCASGKDRTGVIAALLQKLIGVDDEEVINEYRRSGLDTRTEKLLDVLKFVEEGGGIAVYLESCGFSLEDQSQLIEKIGFDVLQ